MRPAIPTRSLGRSERRHAAARGAASARAFLGLLAAIACAPACLPLVEVETRTRVMEDGTAVRETVITKTRRKPNNLREKAWNERPLLEDLGDGLLSAFPGAIVTDDEIRLSGVFASPDAIPADFRRDVEAVSGTAMNRIDFRTEDILVGTRYLYREQYVDAIRPEDQRAARKALIRFCVRFVQAAARHEFGEAYDLSAFDRYIEREVGPLLDDLIGIYWKERRFLGREDPVTGETGLDRALARAEARLARFGLPLSSELSEDDNLQVLSQWLPDLLANTLKPKRESTRAPRASDFGYLFSPEDPLKGIEIAAKRAAEREFGSVGAARRAFDRALLGVTGTFGSPPAQAEFRFDCAVEMPGILLRTNGYLESQNSAFFVFDGQDVFPDGVALELESVVLRPESLGAIRELRHDLDRRDAVRVIAALEGVPASDRARMKEMLARCAAAATLAALPGDDAPAEDRRIRDRLRKVLAVLER